VKIDKKGLFMVWDQRVAGSNPATPTVKNERVTRVCNSLFYDICKIDPGRLLKITGVKTDLIGTLPIKY
jgi:hypothetical protein